LAALGAALALSACATAPRPDDGGSPPFTPDDVFNVPTGWDREDHAAAFAEYRRTCRTARTPEGRRVCALALSGPALDGPAARAFFEREFRFVPVQGAGTLTAYYAPEYLARRTPAAEFSTAVRPRPADLEVIDGSRLNPPQSGRVAARRLPDGGYEPYPDRATIEASPEPNPLAWMRQEDHFFMQLQGSGFLTFEDGSRARAAYAADNGRPFRGVAGVMVERGLLPPGRTSNEAISAWIAENRGERAQEVLNANPRYAFFALQADDGREPAGAAGLPLTPGRAIAVDPAHHRMGDLLWIDAPAPSAGAESYRGLAVALDTGGAIKGPVRADLYLGRGEAAGREAGRVRHPLVLWRLVPR
jgi:membrane-bound lytic murein transglycosylase A